MTKDEWRELIKHIYYQSIEPKLRRRRKHFHPFEWFERYPHELERLMRAMRVIRFIEDNFDEDDDLTEYWKPEFLKRTLDDLSGGLHLNKSWVVETGISDSIEEFFEEIVDGMDVDDIPEQDLIALRQSGSQDPKQECQLSILRLKRKKEIVIKRKETSFSFTIKESVDRLERRKERLQKSNSNEPPKKKLFKGLGTICKGAMLTVVDVSLVAGMWPTGLPTEATTVGAVVSLTTGIGDILIGVGEMRGE